MKKIVLLLTLSLGVLAIIPESIAAEQYIYKWKDSQGMVHYTERPPAAGIPFEKVRRTTEKNAKSAPYEAPKASQQASTTPEDDSYGSWKKENCKIAQQNLDILQNASRIAADDGQGGKRLMTDEEKAEKVKKMTEQVDKYCAKGQEAQN